MPALEVGVDPRGDGWNSLPAAGERLGTERGRDQFADDFGVEGVAGEGQAGCAENLALAVAAKLKDGEVAGAAAEIADQDGLGGALLLAGLEAVGCAERLVFEVDGVEARTQERAAQTFDREGVVCVGFGTDEADRATDGRVADREAELLLGAEPQVGEDARDQLFKQVMAAEDFGSGKRPGGEIRLQRLDETTGMIAVAVCNKIALDGGCAGAREHAALRFFEVQNRARTEAIIHKTQHLHAVWGR